MNKDKRVHRFKVTILQHFDIEKPVILFVKTFSESVFAQVTRPTKEEEELHSKKSKKKEDESEVDNYFEIQTKCDSDAVIKINETRLDLA